MFEKFKTSAKRNQSCSSNLCMVPPFQYHKRLRLVLMPLPITSSWPPMLPGQCVWVGGNTEGGTIYLPLLVIFYMMWFGASWFPLILAQTPLVWFLLKEHPFVSLAFLLVGWQRSAEQLIHKTTICVQSRPCSIRSISHPWSKDQCSVPCVSCVSFSPLLERD